MGIQLRQVCLVAERLEPVVQELTRILGVNSCFIDPGVTQFGLENNLMVVGKNFLEVVAPIKKETAAGRFLEKRKGDGGYMVIVQIASEDEFNQIKQNARQEGVRVAWEIDIGRWKNCQFHPKDMGAAFLEIEIDVINDFEGYWHPAGGSGWESSIKDDSTLDIIGVELQSEFPSKMAARWGRVLGESPHSAKGDKEIHLNNSVLRFVKLSDERGAGLSALGLLVFEPGEILKRALEKGSFVEDNAFSIGGVQWRLHTERFFDLN